MTLRFPKRSANGPPIKVPIAPENKKVKMNSCALDASNVPIGIIDFVALDSIHESLEHGDILIMMSDGVYDGPTFIKNEALWLKRTIRQITTDEPQEIADLLLEEVIRSNE